jgi:hypothetical protein
VQLFGILAYIRISERYQSEGETAMAQIEQVVILSAVRTAIEEFVGGPAPLSE